MKGHQCIHMWRERIIETKKAKGISTKTMAETSNIPAETITRILHDGAKRTEAPRIDTVLELGASVGLEPWEIFIDSALREDIKNVLLLRTEVDRLNTELTLAQSELAVSKDKVGVLTAENEILRLKLEHKEEIISLHNYYNNKLNPSN